MGGSSSSSSSARTTSIQEDNRVVADSGGLALAKGAQINIENQFPDTVVGVFNKLVDFASGAGQVASRTSEEALATISNLQDKNNQGDARVFTDLFPLLVVGLLGIAAITLIKKR